MESLNFLAPLLMISGVAVIVLAIIAVVQDMKQERKYGYRQAFFTIVTLVMLVMSIGAGISLGVIGLKHALPSAKTYSQRTNVPPAPYLAGSPEKGAGLTTAYTCTNGCELTAADKQYFTEWKTTYTNWKATADTNSQLRRELAGALALLIVSLPLYLLFMRWMNRGAREEYQQHQRPSPLRAVYFYGVAFGTLVMAVVGGAMFLNSMLKVALNTTSPSYRTEPTIIGSNVPVDSLLNCSTACGLSADDVALVNEWKASNAASTEKQASNEGVTANDVANALPYVVIGLPLFWYHFSRIRKETPTPSTPPTAV